MYFDTPVSVPDVPGKMTFRRHGQSVYVSYEHGRTYDPERKYTLVKRTTIGKLVDPEDRSKMYPNANFAVHFPGEMPEDCDARCKEELWDAVLESGRSYEEILAMVKGLKSTD